MYSVVKKDGRVVEFNIGRISGAILKAFEALEPVFEELDEMIEEIIGNFEKGLYTFAHSLAHWVFHTFSVISARIRTAICFDSYSAVRLAIVICIRVKLLTASFLEYAHAYRAAWLFRIQDRGVDDNSNSDNIKNIIHHSYISVESL